jgi:hypothetical protein
MSTLMLPSAPADDTGLPSEAFPATFFCWTLFRKPFIAKTRTEIYLLDRQQWIKGDTPLQFANSDKCCD